MKAGGSSERNVEGIDTGDTAWVLMSTALVMLMTPGLAFFYGGLVRRKNVLSILMQCFMLMCLISRPVGAVRLQPGVRARPRRLHRRPRLGRPARSRRWSPIADYAATIPHQLFMIFQMMFAVITPALIIGAFAERMKFCALLRLHRCCGPPSSTTRWPTGCGAWAACCASWGALDFAGGTVVHINAGMAALAAALVLGKRQGLPGHLAAAQPALRRPRRGAAVVRLVRLQRRQRPRRRRPGGNAFVVTHMAAAAAAARLGRDRLDLPRKRPTVLGIITGAVAGLVAITPAVGLRRRRWAPWPSALGAGVICYVSVIVRQGEARLRRLARRLRRARRRRHLGRAGHRPVRHQERQPGRRRRAVLRQPRSVLRSAQGDRGLRRLLLRACRCGLAQGGGQVHGPACGPSSENGSAST